MLYLAMILAAAAWSQREGWNGLHILSLAGGAALSYAWHSFIQQPVTGKADATMRIGNGVLAAATILVLTIGARRTAAAAPQSVPAQV